MVKHFTLLGTICNYLFGFHNPFENSHNSTGQKILGLKTTQIVLCNSVQTQNVFHKYNSHKINTLT